MLRFLKKNNYLLGVIVGLITPLLFYGILLLIETLLIQAGIWKGFNPHHNIYLLSTLINIVLFRYYFVRLKHEKTGKGLLLVTLALILAFFYLYFENPK